MWIWRRVIKVNRMEQRSNQELLDMVSENRDLINMGAFDRQKNWQGYVLRGDSLLRTVLKV